MRRRHRGRHGPRPGILLTDDQASTALLALQDAYRYRRNRAYRACPACIDAGYLCAEHGRDIATAARYRAVAAEIAAARHRATAAEAASITPQPPEVIS